MFVIHCTVSGGVTGWRESYLRSGDTIVTYENETEAQAEADRLNKQTNGNPYRTASFMYRVERAPATYR